MVNVNPEIIRWARETAGLSIEEACEKLHIDDTKTTLAIDRLKKIETGEISPSRTLLLNMANQYHRPLVVFYMEKPPQKGNRGQDFRSLPNGLPQGTNALVDALVRDILARQSIIRAGLEDEEETTQLTFVKCMRVEDGRNALIESITKYLKFDLQEFRKKSSPQEAFTYLRTCVESLGVFVLLKGDLGSHHTALGLEAFRGFAISDNIAPFIVINDKDSKAAWSFTLIHELVHIWLGHTGISNSDDENSIEKLCNDIAGELLLPSKDFFNLEPIFAKNFDEITTYISSFAEKNNISSSMIAYKAYRAGLININIWRQLSKYYQSLWDENKKSQIEKAQGKKGGPNYYVIRRYQNGVNLISTVKRMINGGTLSSTKAGKVLGIKANNVYRLLDTPLILKAGK
jgi:Zn-dependent peptidase ImmA (M78 family)/transcriptional regulator with XRE-family HTH domain